MCTFAKGILDWNDDMLPSKQLVLHLLSFLLRIYVFRQSETHTTSLSFRLGNLVTFSRRRHLGVKKKLHHHNATLIAS